MKNNYTHSTKLQQELKQNFNKRSRLIDAAISRVAGTLNATELLVLNFFANQKCAIYIDRNQLALQLNRSHNSINDAIISLTNLNILAFEFDVNKRTKQLYTRKKKFILNTNTKEWQAKSKADYRLKENRFISSLRSLRTAEFGANLVLATDEYARHALEERFQPRIIKATYLNKVLPEFARKNILKYGLGLILDWIDSVSSENFIDLTAEQLEVKFHSFLKMNNLEVVYSQRIVFRTRHKTMADDYNELDYLQFKSLIARDNERMNIANLYRSTLYRNSQRIHNMDRSTFHNEKHTIAVRKVLLAHRLVETQNTSKIENIDIQIPTALSGWGFIGGQKYPAYKKEYTPIQLHNGKTYQATLYDYVEKTISKLISTGRVRRVSNSEYNDLIKADAFDAMYYDQRQHNYIPELEDLRSVKSNEELMAKGLQNIIRLWDCGAINDIDFEIGYQILNDESKTLPYHCKEAKFNPISYINGIKLNYKQKGKLEELTKYLCLNDATIRLELDGLLNSVHSHQGAFKTDTFEKYLDARFTVEAARELKKQELSGLRTLYLDPFAKISALRESYIQDTEKNKSTYFEERNDITDEISKINEMIQAEVMGDDELPSCYINHNYIPDFMTDSDITQRT